MGSRGFSIVLIQSGGTQLESVEGSSEIVRCSSEGAPEGKNR